MNKAYKYRIYPTEEQISLFNKTFGCCRFIWNIMLADKLDAYKKDKTLRLTTPAMYKDRFPFLKEVDSFSLCNVQLNLEQAYKNFFNNPNKFGKPKFKAKHHNRQSYTTNQKITVFDNFIKILKAGKVKATIHRKAPDNWKLKSATISRQSDNTWYISVLYEYDFEINPMKEVNSTLGLDYKSDGLYADSKERIAGYPKVYRSLEKKLHKAQRKLSRKIGSKKNSKKSNNYMKQFIKVNKIHCKIVNKRNDWLHKKALELSQNYDMIAIETLNMTDVAHALPWHSYRKATYDNSYRKFIDMLRYKLIDRQKYLIEVDKNFPSTQMCSCCGHINPKTKDLSIRVWTCDNCGATHKRDINAAINIKAEGIKILKAMNVRVP